MLWVTFLFKNIVLSTFYFVCGVLTSVCPAVSLQVGTLGVHLVAARKVTSVNSPLFQRVGRLSGDGMLRARVNYYRCIIAPKKQETEANIRLVNRWGRCWSIKSTLWGESLKVKLSGAKTTSARKSEKIPSYNKNVSIRFCHALWVCMGGGVWEQVSCVEM